MLPADRARVLEWTRQPRAERPDHTPDRPEPRCEPGLPTVPRPARLVSDLMREAQSGMRFRAWRDAGSLVAVALAGAGVAADLRTPNTGSVARRAVTWLLALAFVARHVAGRARGRGLVGTAEGNVSYYADPEGYAVGGVLSAGIGAGLGVVAMVIALVAA